MRIALDPGHGMNSRRSGWYDPGACKSGVEEADLAMEYGRTLKWFLREAGYDTHLLRIDDQTGYPYMLRADVAEEDGCRMFVSLHFNSHTKKTARGVEVLYRSKSKDRPLAKRVQRELVKATGFRNRRVQQRRKLAVLKFSRGPAILIEFGFISNKREREWLLQRKNRIKACQAVVRAIKSQVKP